MRRVACARRKIQKERFLRCLGFLAPNPGNRVRCHRVIEIEVLLRWHADDLVILSQKRIELTVFSAEKSPEVVEAERVWPAVERPSRSLLRVRCKMPFADRGGVVAVALKSLRDGGRAGRPLRAVARPRDDSARIAMPHAWASIAP